MLKLGMQLTIITLNYRSPAHRDTTQNKTREGSYLDSRRYTAMWCEYLSLDPSGRVELFMFSNLCQDHV